jgi:beta-phosphoglucomutase-like phosphatase (HAD superfamily)
MGRIRAVIVDIDNTTLSCDQRRAALCAEVAGRQILEGDVRQDLYCSRILTSAQQASYFNAFMSTRLMFMDQPYPCAAEALEAVRNRDVRVIFLSGRFLKPVDKSQATLEFMRRYGIFKDSDMAIFKPSMDVFDFDFKAAEIESLKKKYRILWAIDDTPHSLKIFKQEGIFSIGITTSYPPARFDFADLIVDDWGEVLAGIESGKIDV